MKLIAQKMIVGLVAALAAKAPLSSVMLTKEYVSDELVIADVGGGTITHGLGAMPKMVQVFLICKTAGSGYAVGDVILWGTFQHSSSRGVAVALSATEISYRFSNTTPPLVLLNKNTGDIGGLTNASWRMIIKAWA